MEILYHKFNDRPNNRNLQVKTWCPRLHNERAAGSVSTTPPWVQCQHDNNVTAAATASLIDPLNPWFCMELVNKQHLLYCLHGLDKLFDIGFF